MGLNFIEAKGDWRGPFDGLCPPFCNEFARVSITRSNPDIAYILARGVGAEGTFLDNLQFAPTSIATTVNIDIKPDTLKEVIC
ncbi:MAG: hypothetical protein OEQ24_11500 [Gammaproteobacteria bacterium]|nr:hypothetical protein [Gammaproteobacteria bacterium]